MEKFYRTARYSTEITEVDVVSSTDKTLIVSGKGKKDDYRAYRESDHLRYHATFDDAKSYMIAKIEKNVESLERRLKAAKGELVSAKNRTQSETTDAR